MDLQGNFRGREQTFPAPTPSLGKPPPYRAISGPKKLIFVLLIFSCLTECEGRARVHSGRIRHTPNCGYRFVSPLPSFSRKGICRKNALEGAWGREGGGKEEAGKQGGNECRKEGTKTSGKERRKEGTGGPQEPRLQRKARPDGVLFPWWKLAKAKRAKRRTTAQKCYQQCCLPPVTPTGKAASSSSWKGGKGRKGAEVGKQGRNEVSTGNQTTSTESPVWIHCFPPPGTWGQKVTRNLDVWAIRNANRGNSRESIRANRFAEKPL